MASDKQDYTIENQLQYLIYCTPETNVRVKAILKDDTFWLSQRGMSELFDTTIDKISLRLNSIYTEGELEENATTEIFSITDADGKNLKVNFYNLDAILAVGYRVNSKKATDFRIWATKILTEFIQEDSNSNDNGFKKEPRSAFGGGYFTFRCVAGIIGSIITIMGGSFFLFEGIISSEVKACLYSGGAILAGIIGITICISFLKNTK